MKDLKVLSAYIKPYWRQVLLYVLFNTLSVIFALFSFTLVIPLLKILFNSDELVTESVKFAFSSESITNNIFFFISNIIIEKGATYALFFIAIVVVIATLLKVTFYYLGRYYVVPIKNGVVRDLNINIYKKILYLPLRFFSEEKKGDLMSRMSNDVNEVKLTIASVMNMVIRDPITIIFFLFYLFFSNFHLTLFILLFIPVVGFSIGKIGRTLKKKSFKAQTIFGKLISNLEETLSGLRIIKVFNAEDMVRNRFSIINHNFLKLQNSVERRNALSSPVSEFLGTIVIVVILYIGGSLVLSGDNSLTSEEFIAYLVVFSMLLNPVKSLSSAYYIIQKGMASVQRINEILDIKDKIPEIENPISVNKFGQYIELKNVSFRYDEKLVLKNINLKIEKGTTVAFVGESGSGKSTLVDLISRLYDVSEGEIILDGNNIKDLKIKDLRNLMGNVNQESILFNDTIENNIAFGVEKIIKNDIIEAAKIANAHNFILEKDNNYNENIGDRGAKLSGGQRQRLSIARAVLKNPPIMILDEATSALDTESEKIVQDALNNLMQNRTSIVIAHRLSTVKNADKICVLQNGKIIETGKHDELISKNGNYKKLCDMQMV